MMDTLPVRYYAQVAFKAWRPPAWWERIGPEHVLFAALLLALVGLGLSAYLLLRPQK